MYTSTKPPAGIEARPGNCAEVTVPSCTKPFEPLIPSPSGFVTSKCTTAFATGVAPKLRTRA